MLFVLVDTHASKSEPVYFCGMTGIGPAMTRDLSEAREFDSWQDARRNGPAHWAAMFYEPIPANEDVILDVLTRPGWDWPATPDEAATAWGQS